MTNATILRRPIEARPSLLVPLYTGLVEASRWSFKGPSVDNDELPVCLWYKAECVGVKQAVSPYKEVTPWIKCQGIAEARRL